MFGLVIGTMVESLIGHLRMAVVWIVSGMGGILFTALTSPGSRSVGASTALMGVLGAMAGFLIINWKAMEGNKGSRCCLLIFVIYITFIQIMFGLMSLANN